MPTLLRAARLTSSGWSRPSTGASGSAIQRRHRLERAASAGSTCCSKPMRVPAVTRERMRNAAVWGLMKRSITPGKASVVFLGARPGRIGGTPFWWSDGAEEGRGRRVQAGGRITGEILALEQGGLLGCQAGAVDNQEEGMRAGRPAARQEGQELVVLPPDLEEGGLAPARRALQSV